MSANIGRFEVVRETGKSELGTLYKAYDPKKKRTVALRVLRADTPEAAERSRKYLLQAKAVSVLDSPNIVSIYAGAEEQGLIYVAMEYVEGVALDAAMAAQQGFSSSDLLDISRQVCRGLEHAQSKGIFHRWLTPAAVLTEWDGTVKIFDFAADPGPFATRTGDEIRFMSPEQVQGRAPDARSNVFNWGAILYEIVTGQKAFAGDSADAAQRDIMEVMPAAPNELNPKVPVGISRVIMKALAKNPEYRFQRAGDLVNELEAECGAASRPSVPGVPQINVPSPPPPPAPLPRVEAGPPVIPGLSPNLGSAAASSIASAPVRPPGKPQSEPLPGYAIPAPSMTKEPAPPVLVPVAAPSEAPETIAPQPAKVAVASGPVSLTPRQIKILVGVIGAALMVMVTVMVADGIRGRRLQAEAEAAAAAPLISQTAPEPTRAATSDPITAPAAPAVAPVEPEASVIHIVPPARMAKTRHKTVVAPAAPALGGLVINSMPQGVQVQVDGKVAGLTPASLANLSPGPHMVVLSKPGYVVESRSVQVRAGLQAALAVSLNQLAATAAIASDPPGAAIIIDGRDTGKITPARLVVDKGNHSLTLRKAGFIDTSASLTLNSGETFQFQPTLRALGNADDIKSVGKLKKLISHGGQENMARVVVRTFPKGAQIMFNSRMMDRASPAEFLVGPGTYEVTLTLTGYKPVHKTITIESGGRLEVDESFEK